MSDAKLVWLGGVFVVALFAIAGMAGAAMSRDIEVKGSVRVKFRPVAEKLVEAINNWYRDRGDKPERILLGWRVWVCLRRELSVESDFLAPPLLEFYGLPVSISEERPDSFELLPSADRVRFGK